MNERIKELAVQAGFYANPDVEKFEKFAELIVRECAQFICVLDAEPVSHLTAANLLLEEFGIKK
jgi:hypothetical protein